MSIIKLLKPESPEFLSEDVTIIPGLQKFEVSTDDLQKAFDVTVYNGLSVVSLGLSGLYLVVTIRNLLALPKPVSSIMGVVAASICGFYLITYFVTQRSLISPNRANAIGALFTIVPMFHAFLLNYFLPDKPLILTLLLTIIGAGCFLLSLRWLMLVVSVAVGGWVLVIWLKAQINWSDQTVILVSSILLSYLVFNTRIYTLRQMEILNIKYKHRKTELEKTLGEKERTNSYLEKTLKNFSRAQEDLRLLINSINGIVWEVDVNSLDFIFVSKKAEEILGYPITQWYKEKDFWKNRLYPEDREMAFNIWQEGVKKGQNHSIEYRMITANGNVVWFKDLVTVIAENNSFVKIAGVMLDITDRKEIELAAIRSERRYRDLFENANDVIYSHNLEGKFTSVNSYTEKLLCYSREEILQMNISQVLNKGDLEKVKERMKRRLVGENFSAQELELTSKDGRKIIVETSSWLEVENGVPIAIHGISRDITERKQAEELLKVARDKALEAANLKSQFVANMSHEIRTPLNGIIGMTYLLLDTELTEKQLEHIETIRNCGDILLNIINDVLDLAKIEAKKLQLEEIEFDLRTSIEEIIKIFTVKANKKGLNLYSEMHQAIPDNLLGDPNRLKQILMNLIGNAVKFTDKGSVTLIIKPEQIEDEFATIRFEIKDTGIGISKEAKNKLFQPFVQADNSTTRKYGGTGLGLAICKELVESMLGEIAFDSVVGEGSTFWFTVKLKRETKVRENTKQEPVEEKVKEQTKAKVLLVEDNLVNQSVAISILSKLGCNVDVADNGLKALGALFRKNYDLIFMDCQMPVMDGYETTIAIREREIKTKSIHIPIIALTAGAMQQDYERCLKVGMDDYLTKPFKPEQIDAMLRKWFRKVTKNGLPKNDKPIFQPQVNTSNKMNTLDLDMLAQLIAVSSDDDGGFFSRIVKLFIKTADESLLKINSFMQNQDMTGLRKEAHKFKSACGNVGAAKMHNICNSLDKLEDLANLKHLVEELNLEYEAVKKEFSKLGFLTIEKE